MGLGPASVMRAPHPKGPDRLRDCPFHSGSLLVLFFEFLALLAPPTCLQRFVCFLRADCDRSPHALGSSAMYPTRARLAVETRELDLYHLIVHVIYSRCPAQTRLLPSGQIACCLSQSMRKLSASNPRPACDCQ